MIEKPFAYEEATEREQLAVLGRIVNRPVSGVTAAAFSFGRDLVEVEKKLKATMENVGDIPGVMEYTDMLMLVGEMHAYLRMIVETVETLKSAQSVMCERLGARGRNLS